MIHTCCTTALDIETKCVASVKGKTIDLGKTYTSEFATNASEPVD